MRRLSRPLPAPRAPQVEKAFAAADADGLQWPPATDTTPAQDPPAALGSRLMQLIVPYVGDPTAIDTPNGFDDATFHIVHSTLQLASELLAQDVYDTGAPPLAAEAAASADAAHSSASAPGVDEGTEAAARAREAATRAREAAAVAREEPTSVGGDE